MAHRILMKVFITGSQVVGKAFIEAYRQASSASLKASATAATREKFGSLDLREACKILDVDESNLKRDEVQKKFDYLFDANSAEKSGSFYLQSKAYRAFERLKHEIAESEKQEADKPNEAKPK